MGQAFDFGKLLNDPSFMFGASILGNSHQPNVVGNSFGNIARMNELNQQRALQQAQIENFKAVQEHQIKQDAIAAQQFNRQDQQTQMQIQMERRKFEMQQQYIQSHPEIFGSMGSEGGGGGLFGPGTQQAAPQGPPPDTPVPQPSDMQPQPGSQGQNFEFNRPAPGMGMQPQPPGGIEQVAPFDPNDPRDPAGPFSGGKRDGTFGPIPPGSVRPTMKTNVITPDMLLNGLAQVESSGNPNAVNPQSGAEGMYQFMPGTTAQIRQRDPNFDPRNPQMAKVEARRMLENLTAKNGGSLERALAAYGGFKTKDPSGYIQKVMKNAGAGVQPPQGMIAPQQAQGDAPQGDAPGGPVNVDGGMGNPGLTTMRNAAALGFLGFPGAQQMSEYGKALAPQNVAAGSYQRDPRTGKMQYIQDPMATARLAMEGQRVGMEGQRLGMDQQRLTMEQKKQQYEMGSGSPGQLPQKAMDAINSQRFETANSEINKSLDLHKELPNQLAALQRAQGDVDALLKNRNALTPIGFAANAKMTVLKTFKNTFGYDAPKDVANAEDFNAAMAQLWMKAVKQVDQNPTASQQKSIMASFGTLQNDPAALKRILSETQTSFVRQMQRHNKAVAQYQSKVGSDPFDRFLDTGTSTPAGTRVGQQEHGYTYIGGNPADQNSWTK